MGARDCIYKFTNGDELMNIWQEIWDADMRCNGLVPLIKDVSDYEADDSMGYVIVDTDSSKVCPDNPTEHCEIKVLVRAVIPKNRERSYNIFKKFLNNYRIGRKCPENFSEENEKEIIEFLTFAIKTEPMKIAREYAEHNKYVNGYHQWLDLLYEIWFEGYQNKSTCGFEHVFIGEQGENPHILAGHHFWYHYYLHNGPYNEFRAENSIYFIRHVDVKFPEQSNRAEVITIKYIYKAKDIDNPDGIELVKRPKGGFFIGLSAEGLLAFGTVAMLDKKKRRHIPIVINSEMYNVKVTREGKHLRTFYPVIT